MINLIIYICIMCVQKKKIYIYIYVSCMYEVCVTIWWELQAVKLLLKCNCVDRNAQNKDGFTPLDILRANGRFMETRTEKLIKRSGGKSKASLSKVKTSSEFLRSPVNYWEYCSITMTRYRSGISDGNRNALLVITILVITATYTIEPPKWEKEKRKGFSKRVCSIFRSMASTLGIQYVGIFFSSFL